MVEAIEISFIPGFLKLLETQYVSIDFRFSNEFIWTVQHLDQVNWLLKGTMMQQNEYTFESIKIGSLPEPKQTLRQPLVWYRLTYVTFIKRKLTVP